MRAKLTVKTNDGTYTLWTSDLNSAPDAVHQAKSTAGRLVDSPSVEWVKVTCDGQTYFQIVKDMEGHSINEKFVCVPSKLA